MKNFCIKANDNKDIDFHLSNKILNYINSHGGNCLILGDDTGDKNSSDCRYRFTNPTSVSDKTECVITIGGDGTLLQAAHDLIGKDMIFLGINKGNLGFLAENVEDDIEQILDRLLKDDFHIEERMMLQGKVVRKGKEIYDSVALNDIVIHRQGGLRVCDYKIFVNNLLLNEFHADGIIIATPTGSTAYSMSAGGPIVDPKARLMVLTPICSHSLNGRSIVLSAKDKISVEICPSRNCDRESSVAYFDGYGTPEIGQGDIVEIECSKMSTKLVKLKESSFLQVLKDKMGDE